MHRRFYIKKSIKYNQVLNMAVGYVIYIICFIYCYIAIALTAYNYFIS